MEKIIYISSLCATLIPIFTLVGIIIPKTRVVLSKIVKSLVGYAEIENKLKFLETDTKNKEQAINSSLKDLTEQIKISNAKLDDHLKGSESRKVTDKTLLRSSLIRSFIFYIERKYITFEELEVLQLEYEQYRALGGNGVIQRKWENEILKLPNHPV